MMDNRIFNVNGEGRDMLQKALELVFQQEGKNTACRAWKQTREQGLILLWSNSSGAHELPAPLTAEECVPMIEKWLASDFAKTVELSKWCGNLDHDGDNGTGWQVYCEDWGHVGGDHYAICAIKPAYMWYGK